MVTGKPIGLLILFLSSVDEENTHNNDIKNISCCLVFLHIKAYYWARDVAQETACLA